MLFTHTFAVNYTANLVTVLINEEAGSYLSKILLTESGAIALAESLSKDEKGKIEMVDGTIYTYKNGDESLCHVLELHKGSGQKALFYKVYCKHGSQIEHLIENLKVAAEAVSTDPK
jgi:hypothetical protein